MLKKVTDLDVIVSHTGARERYAVASALENLGALNYLVTDIYLSPSSPLLSISKRRFHSGIPVAKVVTLSLLVIAYNKLRGVISKSHYDNWVSRGKQIASLTRQTLISKPNKKSLKVIWSYTACGYETFKSCSNSSYLLVLNQIDPAFEYYRIKGVSDIDNNAFLNRVRQEMQMAQIIVVNSEYCKKALVKHHISPQKIEVLPLIAPQPHAVKRLMSNARLKVGFVGSLSFMKGYDVFCEVARSLCDIMDFTAAGKLEESFKRLSENKVHVDEMGLLDSKEINNFYDNLDILVFPTRSDGFGMVQLEAMAHGIPVISSSTCADVVVENKCGFKGENAIEIKEVLLKYHHDRKMLKSHSDAALKRCEVYSAQNFTNQLKRILTRHLN
ncbi:MAG: glycosyltransferase family 4 protein [Nonlabens sp.]